MSGGHAAGAPGPSAGYPVPPLGGRVRVVLTDLEGTTSSLRFVKQVLFPYAHDRLGAYVAAHPAQPEVQAALAAVQPCTDGVAELRRWIELDRKDGALKALQGCIWQEGYAQGTLRGHFWPDAVTGLRRLVADGYTLAVYSSGSVQAQQLLFRHSEAGDLSGLVSAWFDTRVGAKQDPVAYREIVAALRVSPDEVLFLSDVPAELDAARIVGLHTCCLERGEEGLPPPHGHAVASSFDMLPL